MTALGLNMPNIAKLMFAKHIYFVPFGQDNPFVKPNSLVSRMDLIMETCEASLQGKQLQPILIESPSMTKREEYGICGYSCRSSEVRHCPLGKQEVKQHAI